MLSWKLMVEMMRRREWMTLAIRSDEFKGPRLTEEQQAVRDVAVG